MRTVTSEEVAAYEGLVKTQAIRYTGKFGAEADDLEQEGRIAVWLAIATGHLPSKIVVSSRMKDWVRYCSRKGLSGHDVLTDGLEGG